MTDTKLDWLVGTHVIMGGTKGIGRQTAIDLAREAKLQGVADQVNIVLAARSQQPIDDTIAELTPYGVHASGYSVDATNAASVEKLFKALSDQGMNVHNVLYFSGATQTAPIKKLSPEQRRRIMDTNYEGAVNTFLSAEPLLEKSGKGQFWVALSHVVYDAGGTEDRVPSNEIYAVSKAAAEQFVIHANHNAKQEDRTVRLGGSKIGHFRTQKTEELATLYDDVRRKMLAMPPPEDAGVYLLNDIRELSRQAEENDGIFDRPTIVSHDGGQTYVNIPPPESNLAILKEWRAQRGN